MNTPIFVYGSFRPGMSEHDIFDLYVDTIVDAVLPDSSLYLTIEPIPRALAVEDSHKDGIIGELYWIKPEHRARVLENANEVVAPEVSLVLREVMNVETGEIVEALVYMVDESVKGFYENEADRVEGGDFEDYQTAVMDSHMEDAWEDDDSWWDKMDEEDRAVMGYAASDYASEFSVRDYSYTPATKAARSYTSSFRVEKGNENSMYVWYIGYGSNMNEERFLKYMNAGRYGKDQFVESDFESRRVLIDHGVYFARSGRWGNGGIAFLDVDDVEDKPWYARAYRITAEQLWSLACQENGSRTMQMDWVNMTNERFTELSKTGLYTRVVNMGTINDEHVFTVTNNTSYAHQLKTAKEPVPYQYLALGMINPPSAEYLNIINSGAAQVQDLEEATLVPFIPPAKVKASMGKDIVRVSVTKADKANRKPVTSLVPSA